MDISPATAKRKRIQRRQEHEYKKRQYVVEMDRYNEAMQQYERRRQENEERRQSYKAKKQEREAKNRGNFQVMLTTFLGLGTFQAFTTQQNPSISGVVTALAIGTVSVFAANTMSTALGNLNNPEVPQPVLHKLITPSRPIRPITPASLITTIAT